MDKRIITTALALLAITAIGCGDDDGTIPPMLPPMPDPSGVAASPVSRSRIVRPISAARAQRSSSAITSSSSRRRPASR